MLKFHYTPYEDEPFLFRSPEEIREDLDAMRKALQTAKERLSRLCAVKEELEQFSLPADALASFLPRVREQMDEMRREVKELGEDCTILQEEMEDALYLLRDEEAQK